MIKRGVSTTLKAIPREEAVCLMAESSSLLTADPPFSCRGPCRDQLHHQPPRPTPCRCRVWPASNRRTGCRQESQGLFAWGYNVTACTTASLLKLCQISTVMLSATTCSSSFIGRKRHTTRTPILSTSVRFVNFWPRDGAMAEPLRVVPSGL